MTTEDILKLFPDEEKEKVLKFMANIIVAKENEENTMNCLKIISEYGLLFRKATDIRILSIPSETLKAKIEAYEKAGYLDLIKSDVEKLRFDENEIIERIKACEKIGKGYYDENGLCSFLFKNDEWKNVNKGMDNTSAVASLEEVFKGKNISFNDDDINPEFDSADFDKYLNLLSDAESVMQSLYGFAGINEKALKSFVVNKELTEEEIILATIISSKTIETSEIDKIKEVIHEVLENTNNLKESFGGAR